MLFLIANQKNHLGKADPILQMIGQVYHFYGSQ